MVNKQKRRKGNNAEPQSSESSNSSVIEDEPSAPYSLGNSNSSTTITTATSVKNLQQMSCSRKNSCTLLNNDQTTSEETERTVGKATYSETVRRCASLSTTQSEKKEFCKKGKLSVASVSAICSTVIPIPGRKCQKKDSEKSYYLLHNRSRKCSGKKLTKSCDVGDPQMEEISGSKLKSSRNDVVKESSVVPSTTSVAMTATKHGKKKESACIEFLDGKFGGKASDRGWSVWYSSKRKQSLSPLALSKLEMIHQAIWQMKEAEIFKCPSSGNGSQNSTHTVSSFLFAVEFSLNMR